MQYMYIIPGILEKISMDISGQSNTCVKKPFRKAALIMHCDLVYMWLDRFEILLLALFRRRMTALPPFPTQQLTVDALVRMR